MTVKGFQTLPEQFCPDAGGTLRQFMHEKTGASVFWMDNGAENKVFSITFRTLPENSRGVFHILEHSVLNGSEKYPCKGLFSELLKGSLQTYLNAMTHPDRTTFAIASRNGQDFANLMDVYLDSVFFPEVLRDERIFRQEGWRYEVEEVEVDECGAALAYNGVVYNEMKGDYSSPDVRLINGLAAALYPDTSYAFVSGGDPACIPELSYDELKAMHAKYYHPSNACVYLDGDVDIAAALAKIDAYFDRFEGRGGAVPMPVQQAWPFAVNTDAYPAADEEDGALMMMGQLLPGLGRADLEALSILCGCLTGTNESPLTRAVLGSGIARDAYIYLDTANPVPAIMMTMRQMEPGRLEEAPQVVRDALAAILQDGISRSTIEAEIDQLEYILRDLDEPQGLYREDLVVRSWLYGQDPAAALDFSALIGTLRGYLDSGRYEELLGMIRFEGDGCAVFTLLPSETKVVEEAKQESARLKEAEAGMTEAQLAQIAEQAQVLEAWQMEPEDEEKLALIPQLSVKDLGAAEERLHTEETQCGGMRMLLHPAKVVDIGYFALYFPVADLCDEEIALLSFMTNVFTGLATKEHGLMALDDRIKSLMGDLDFDVVAFADLKDPAVCRPYFKVKFGALKKNEQQAIALVREILTKTCFAGEDSLAMLRMILLQCRESMFSGILEEGDRFAMARAASHLTAAGHVREVAEGVTCYEWISRMAAACTQESDEAAYAALADLAKRAAEMAARVFTASRLTASITSADPEDSAAAVAAVFGEAGNAGVNGGAEGAPAGGAAGDETMRIAPAKAHAPEFIVIPAAVGYAARAGWCGSQDVSDGVPTAYSGARQVLASIVDLEYLWNEIRVRGGAYGCGVFLSATGSAGFSSFRDPDPMHSLQVFGGAGRFTESFFKGHQDIERYIVGTIGATEPLIHVREQAARADADWFMQITAEERANWRAQLLGAHAGELAELASYFDSLITCDCIVGGQELLDEKAAAGWEITYLK